MAQTSLAQFAGGLAWGFNPAQYPGWTQAGQGKVEEFKRLLGKNNNNGGGALYNSFAPGMNWNDGQYVATQSGGQYKPYGGGGYELMAGFEGVDLWRRKDPPPTPAPETSPAPTPAPTPTPPADRIDANTPSLADALSDQGNASRPALQDALDSALQLNRRKDGGNSGGRMGSGSEPKTARGAAGTGRRFAASDRWRQRLDEVSSRFA